jgi:hypothetical protein
MEFQKFRNEIAVEDGRRMTKRDYIVLLILLAVYSLFAFINLGSLRSPNTVWTAEPDTTVIVDLGETRDVTEMRFFGNIAEGNLQIYDESAFINGFFTPGETEPLETFVQDNGDMYKWTELSVETETRYLILYVDSGRISMNEIAILDGSTLLPATVYEPTGGAEKLLDEQSKVALNDSYLDGMYFDEIYHARTAYEIVQNDNLLLSEGREAAARDGYSIYEWTHPTFGKLMIAIGIRIFGMTPFGWRFAGTFFGVLILAALYVFAKRIFRRTDYAFVTAGLFAADCMHFAQTRIATIDTYALFFTLLMFLFMGDYIAEDFEKRPYWKKLALLGLSGIMFGLGVSSKWTCLYSGAGLAVLYFSDLIYNLVRIIRERKRQEKAYRQYQEMLRKEACTPESEQITPPKKLPVNVLAYAPVLFVLGVLVLHVSGHWIDAADYRYRNYVNGAYVSRLNAEYGVDTIKKVFCQPWFYGTLLILIAAAIVSAVAFRLAFSKRKDVDLSLNDLLMTPVWCCLFFIAIPIALYAATNYCYYIKAGDKTLPDMLGTLWREQVSMYRYHADLDATHMCQSMWYQWPLMQKSVWFYSGYPVLGETKLLSNISSTGNPAMWYVSAFGAVFAAVEWFRNPACRKDRAFIVVFVGILAGLLPWALVTRCVFLYHYFSTIPFMMLLTLLLLYYVEKKYPRTAWFKWAWLIATVVVFLLMLPAVSGIPVPYGYAKFIENVLAPFGKVYYVGV